MLMPDAVSWTKPRVVVFGAPPRLTREKGKERTKGASSLSFVNPWLKESLRAHAASATKKGIGRLSALSATRLSTLLDHRQDRRHLQESRWPFTMVNKKQPMAM
jgi:hypothetical protein